MNDNTYYTLSLSYGKDSLACLGAIEKLGLPLNRIVHAEVWATQTIPADLPPMVEFKKKADKIIKERWGIEVEHVCAVNKNGGGLHTNNCLIDEQAPVSTENTFMDSLVNSNRGATQNSKLTHYPKLTYEDIFYRTLKPRRGGREQLTASQQELDNGATANSKGEYSTGIYGFPYGSWMGGWCRELKRKALRFPRKLQNGKKPMVYGAQERCYQKTLFFKPEHDGRYKYRAIFRNSK